MFRGSRGSKKRVTKAVGAEPSGAKAVNRVGILWQDNCKYIWEICEELKGFRESGCHVGFLVRQLNYQVLSLSIIWACCLSNSGFNRSFFGFTKKIACAFLKKYILRPVCPQFFENPSGGPFLSFLIALHEVGSTELAQIVVC